MEEATTVLWWAVGPEGLERILRSGMRAFPPRLSGRPHFDAMTTEAYAVEIARDWNVAASGAGFVTRFAVRTGALARHPEVLAGEREHGERRIMAGELAAFDGAIVGPIEVVHAFGWRAASDG